jgi:ubiquitin-conjugating enzyme (huntingtin interacting protein 2)
MATTRERRIAKELADLYNDKDASGVVATPVDPANLAHLKGTFPGPPDTPYAGGTFHIDIVIPDMYPFKSPAMKFETKIWHPNVSSVTVRALGLLEMAHDGGRTAPLGIQAALPTAELGRG